MIGPPPNLRSAGDTSVGKVRTTNEDALIIEPAHGLYAVLDGMGGANAGDIASQTARDAIRDYVVNRSVDQPPRELLEAAIIAGSTAVFAAAQNRPERQGMGTTVVACLVVDGRPRPAGGGDVGGSAGEAGARPGAGGDPDGSAGGAGARPRGIDPTYVVVGHVGDSRAYLLRNGRLQTLTRDHTIVEELAARGLLTADDAVRHPYKNVLSRNLGSRPYARVDTVELELRAGDRLLLCSDGLYGYASAEAIQYLLGSGDAPDDVARDLVELALRGGGGDNVSAIVVEAPPAPPSSTQLVRTTGATIWWKHRQRFLQIASDGGLVRNPIVRGLPAKEALDLVALSLCQAVYHDLEKSTGVNVWTFAQNLAAGWFERGGDWQAVRSLVDILSLSARAVVDDIRAADTQLGFLLDVAVSRAFIVIELALGGLLSERLGRVDREVVELHSAAMDTLEDTTLESLEVPEQSVSERSERVTVPFLRPDRPVASSDESAEVLTAIAKAITLARSQVSPRAELVAQILIALQLVATDGGGNFAAAVQSARELYGIRAVDNTGVIPLFDAFDKARILTASCVHQLRAPEPVRMRALRALSTAHQRLVGATTGLVLEAVGPFSERLREAQAVTGELRDAVAKAERQRADLEHQFATIVDASLPWGERGTTEW